MNVDKRDIILKEIQYWRRSKLLPEQYCDFLTNLYDDEATAVDRNPVSLHNLRQGNVKVWLFGFGIISLILLIGFYFSVFPLGLQIATAVSILIVCYGYSGVWRNRRPSVSLALAGAGSFLTLGFGLWIIALHGWDQTVWTPALVGFCGVLWAVLGFALRIGLLQYAGFGCLALLYAGFFRSVRPEAPLWELELLWLPLAVLMVWLSWLLHHRVAKVAGVYFAAGVTFWLMPELDCLLLRQDYPQWIAFVLILKLAAGFGLLFGFRKNWITWVSS